MHLSLVGDVDGGRGWVYVGAGYIQEISVSSAQFYCESKNKIEREKSAAGGEKEQEGKAKSW